MAQVAITALSLTNLSKAHWVARSFFLASLMSGVISVYYAMHQLRVLGQLITRDKIKKWLIAPSLSIRCEDKNQPSLRAILILDTPRSLVDMAAGAFILGLSIYVVFIFVDDLDIDAGPKDSRNVVIAYFFTLLFCLLLFRKAALFDYSMSADRPWNVGSFWDSLDDTWRAILGKLPLHADDSEGQQPPPIRASLELRNDVPPAVPIIESSQSSETTNITDNSLLDLVRMVVESRQRCAEADERLAKAFECLAARQGEYRGA